MAAKNRRGRPIDDEKVQSLIDQLTTGSPEGRRAAAGALGAIGVPRAVLALVQLRQDKSVDGSVPFYVSHAFGKIRNPAAVPALMKALDDEATDAFTRLNIVGALEAIGDMRAAPSLILALKDRDTDIRLRAVVALGTWKSKEAVPALIVALKDTDRVTKSCAGENGSREIYGYQYVRDEAATALGRIGDARAVPALREALRVKRYYGCDHVRVIRVLGEIGGPLAVDSLIEAVDNVEDSEEAVKALTMIGPPTFPALIEALSREKTRSLMILALIKILKSNEYLLCPGDLYPCRAAELLKVIAAYQPDPALRAALPTLRWSCLRSREPAFGEALKQIQAVTATSRSLPRPAAAPPPDVGTLPRPAADVAPGDPVTPAPQGFWIWLRRRLRSF